MAAVMISERPVSPRRRSTPAASPRSRCARLVAVPDPSPSVRTATRVVAATRVAPATGVASGARTSRATFRRRRLGVLLGVVVVAIMAGQAGAALGSASLAAPGRAPSGAAVTRYVVQPGDSLWSAAEHLAPNDDPREVVDTLVRVRGNGPLMPGEVLRWQR
ncbi:MAG: hypothetical protein JJE46_16440 [Acidimicrobiia bacterium]|nr:hypothetical protein [Acidimicrobiia bacterium]